MSDPECTAIDRVGAEPVNPLFTPQCACPRCAPDPVVSPAAPGAWLRVSGRRQRLRVVALQLGPDGQAMLG